MASKDATRIRQYLNTLERDDRYILLLYYADGLTTLEIGSVLGLSASKVDNRLGYFRTRLGGMLDFAKPPANPATHPRPAAYA
ncbi:MAG: sigma factor-like helix-turn-helix DNA-binding protein [Phycisphaerales bacterium JB063]